MNRAIETGRAANLTGSLWMVAAMGAFALEDACVKALSRALPVDQLLMLFGLGGALVFACVAQLNREPLFTRDVVSRPMLIRAVFEVSARLFYALALALIPLSAATVIMQATPLVVVAGAVLVFREKVGWRRWAAIFIGLAGVVVIIRPGTDGFSALSLLAVGGMIGFAGRDLASRVAPASLATSTLGFYGFLAIMVAGAIYSLWQTEPFVMPGAATWPFLLGVVLAGVTGYSCLMKAMRTGEVSAVTPFRYSRLLFGVALGVVFFGERLSGAMLLGSGLIVVSGLFILWRGKKVKQS